MTGLSLVDLGASKVSMSGEVFGLDHVSDFAGTYSAASVGVVAGVGGTASILENQHDVVLKLTAKQAGIQLTLAAQGVKIKILD